MSHVAEGSLQAYLDGEIDGPAAAGVRDHVATCALCAAELNALRQAGERVHVAIGLLEAPAPMLRAQAAIAAARREERDSARSARRQGVLRLGSWGLAKAAMLLLVLAGAGAAAIPDVRRALESTLARVAELFTGSQPDIATPTAPAPEPAAAEREVRQALVQPVDGSVRIVVAEPAAALDVVVRLIDGNRADVQTSTTEPVRFVSSTGRLELAGVTGGEITIGIPRDLAGASVDVGRAARIVKDGAELVLTGPVGAQRGSEVRFTIRP